MATRNEFVTHDSGSENRQKTKGEPASIACSPETGGPCEPY